MEHKISANSNSVINSGLTDDYRKAIAEYIWNGFDAGASCVAIHYHSDAFGCIDDLSIEDNGKGINYDALKYTFGAFLDSNKSRTDYRSSAFRGKKGKGRFSYNVISDEISWITQYQDDEGGLRKYKIFIRSSDMSVFETDLPVLVPKTDLQKTGTTVRFLRLKRNLFTENLKNDSFLDYISSEFAWYLILNQTKKYKILINDVEVDADRLIGDKEKKYFLIGDSAFECLFIRWSKKIGEKYYFYLLNSDRQEVCKVLTSFNNRATTFHHSLYISSDYFNNFVWDQELGPRLDGLINQSDEKYKDLICKLLSYLSEKEKEYNRAIGAKELISQYEKEGVLPLFTDDKYGKERKQDLINAIQGIYTVQPKIFLKLANEQRKTMVGFLNLLLESNERNNVIKIIENVVQLTQSERAELANTLCSTNLSRINSTISLIKNRLSVIERLKKLVYDMENFTNERNHIQNIVEENYWLFGEQYNLVTADKPFVNSLLEYTFLLEGKAEKDSAGFSAEDGRRRPDIFLCRSHSLPSYSNSIFLEENIIVELKRPSVVIGKDQFRQVEDYRDIILKQPKFQSQRRKWIFIVVGKKVDDYIREQYKSFIDKNRPLLVHYQNNFEIYAMTWDDVFLTFEHRQDYILKKLNFDKQVICNEIASYEKSRSGANALTKDILRLDTK